MAKINDTTTFPNTIPALTDFVIGTDVSDTGNSADGEVVTFRFTDIFDIIPLETRYVHTFATTTNTGNTINALDNFSAVVVDLAYYGNWSEAGSSTMFVKASLSKDSGSSYGSDVTLFQSPTSSNFTFDGSAKVFIDLATGAYKGFYGGTGSVSGTLNNYGTGVTNLKLTVSGINNMRLSGSVTCVGGIKLPSEF